MATILEESIASLLSPLPSPKRVAVAVSGGADSMALAWALSQWATSKGVALWGVTVDHRMRPESASEARFVGKILGEWGVPHTTLPLREGLVPLTQERARLARYDHLARFCHAQHIPVLCLGHHQSDQLETWLMRLRAGSGLRGLGGMAEETRLFGVRVVRPFLKVSPQFLRHVLTAHGIPWVEDPSNQLLKYQRVRVRNMLADFSQNQHHFWTQQIHHLTQKRSVGEKRGRGWLARHIQIQPPDGVVLDGKAWRDLGSDDQQGILSILLEAVGGRKRHPPPAPLVARLGAALLSPSFGRLTGGGCLITRKAQHLLFQREWQRIQSLPVPLGSLDMLWDGRFYLKFYEPSGPGLWIRPWGEGSTPRPSGLSPSAPRLEKHQGEAGDALEQMALEQALWLGEGLWSP